jgi:hypothetical protein
MVFFYKIASSLGYIERSRSRRLSAPARQQSRFTKLLDMCFRSPVFNAMFNHNMRESETKALNIEDLDMDTVKDMLRYRTEYI